MSKYMQIEIRLVPFYEKVFAEQFQGIASVLEQYGYKKHMDNNPSLYLMVDYLVNIIHAPDISRDIKNRIAPCVVKMSDLKAAAREMLLSRKLEELDQCLYQLEDQFEELEKNI